MVNEANIVIGVKYDDVRDEVKIINAYLEELKDGLKNLTAIALESGAWESKYQRAYENHIKTVSISYIQNVIKCCEKYNTYLIKTVGKYQKLDVLR